MIVFLATIVAIVANTIFVWPQVYKVWREGTVGVSATTWAVSASMFSVWASWAFRDGFWTLCAANISCFIAALLILAVGRKDWTYKPLMYAVASAIIALTISIVAVWILVPIVMFSGIIMRFPQLVKAYRTTGKTAVSLMTWTLSIITASSWLIVSVSRGATPVIVANILALATTFVLVGIIMLRNRRTTKNIATYEPILIAEIAN